MTTIATDGRSMVCDGRSCVGDTIACNNAVKITRLKDGSLLGLSGRASVQPKLAAWLNNEGAFPKDCGDWSALHLLPGEVRFYNQDASEGYNPLDLPAAVGSGREFAIGAMLAGASAQKAVHIATQADPFSGGKITTVHLEQLRSVA